VLTGSLEKDGLSTGTEGVSLEPKEKGGSDVTPAGHVAFETADNPAVPRTDALGPARLSAGKKEPASGIGGRLTFVRRGKSKSCRDGSLPFHDC